ncbi:MAG: anthrone oxygenase family protein [Streptosporangiaceae bacterium]
MSDRSGTLALAAATVTTGLLAGVYSSFSVAVMPGLARTDGTTYVTAMNEINKAIVNPLFLAGFLGAPACTVAAACLLRRGRSRWLLVAAGLNVLALITTIAINVPLNDALLRDRDLAAFEDTWLLWNGVRAVATAGALGCLVRVLLVRANRA